MQLKSISRELALLLLGQIKIKDINVSLNKLTSIQIHHFYLNVLELNYLKLLLNVTCLNLIQNQSFFIDVPP